MTVYFIQAEESKRIKIGYTSNSVASRLSNLQTGSAEILSVIGVISDGGKGLERFLHSKFSDDRLHNEWFGESDELSGFIKTECEIGTFNKPKERPSEAHKVITSLGRDVVCSLLSVKGSALSNALHREILPASWYLAIKRYGDDNGIEIPVDAFKWRESA